MPNHEYRVQRGRILKILYRAYDGEVSGRVIALTLNDIRLPASSGTLKAHCTFLADRGLINIEEVNNFDIDFLAKLTPDGVSFVEKDKSDDTIDLGA